MTAAFCYSLLVSETGGVGSGGGGEVSRLLRLPKLLLRRRLRLEGARRRLRVDFMLRKPRAGSALVDGRAADDMVVGRGGSGVSVVQHGQVGTAVSGSRSHICVGLTTASSKMGIAVGGRLYMGDVGGLGVRLMRVPLDVDGRSHIGGARPCVCSGKRRSRDQAMIRVCLCNSYHRKGLACLDGRQLPRNVEMRCWSYRAPKREYLDRELNSGSTAVL